MKYRGKRRNKIENGPTKIRSFTKESLIKELVGCKYIGDILTKNNIKNHSANRAILYSKLEEYNIDFSHIKTSRSRLIDLTGRIFGHLKVIERSPTLKSGTTLWICEEIGTGIKKPVSSAHLLRGATKAFTIKKRGPEHAQWKGHEQISGNHWWGIKRGALSKKIPFEITIEDAWNLFLKQDRKCALSGLDIYFPESYKCPFTASLDRIDSSKNYTIDNLQWVHKTINLMKNTLSQERFIEMCRLVSLKSYNL